MTREEISLICELPNYTSFLDASYYLPYSPSIITKYVNSFEEELGIQIFIRSNKSRNLQLTPEGIILMESLKRIDEDFNYLQKKVNLLKNKESSKLRIGSQPRFGNIHEQKIIADFFFSNPSIQINMTKAPADDLIRNLVSGHLDLAFVTFHNSLNLDSYFGEKWSKMNISFITSETSMYAGISENFFEGRDEVRLKELEDFTFAFPFPDANDIQSARATQSWNEIATKKNVKLKYINLQGYDSTIFEMARQKKIAVTTTHIPSAKHEGIKFVRISDWIGGTNLYILKRKDSTGKNILAFEECVKKYIESI